MREEMRRAAEEIMQERFDRDALIALATMDGARPSVRTVNAWYEAGSFYVITHAKSGKMAQLTVCPQAGVCGDWFTGHGIGENIGHPRAEKNQALMAKLRAAFAAWYDNGHVDEADENTCILRVRLTDGVLLSHGTRYDLRFSQDGTLL